MFTQLPEEKKDLVKPLYKKHQPNWSALCLRTIKELEKMGIKPIWDCDKDNVETDRLAQRLGYENPLEYEFVYLESTK